MQSTPKANNFLGHFFALLGAVVMLAIATWVSASSSQQVKPLDNLATPRTGHTATVLSDGSILITGGRDSDGNLVAASEIFDPETQTSSASATLNTASPAVATRTARCRPRRFSIPQVLRTGSRRSLRP